MSVASGMSVASVAKTFQRVAKRRHLWSVAVTGHRPGEFDDGYEPMSPIKDWVQRQMYLKLRMLKPAHVIVGMALGVDQWMAELCVHIKMPFHAYIPFEGQEAIWPSESRMRYHELLKEAEVVIAISPPGYAPAKMHARNHAMVNACHKLLAVWNGKESGGTFAAVQYAGNVGKEIVRIDPRIGERFIEKKESEMRARCNARGDARGGHYSYQGGLKWKFTAALPRTAP